MSFRWFFGDPPDNSLFPRIGVAAPGLGLSPRCPQGPLAYLAIRYGTAAFPGVVSAHAPPARFVGDQPCPIWPPTTMVRSPTMSYEQIPGLPLLVRKLSAIDPPASVVGSPRAAAVNSPFTGSSSINLVAPEPAEWFREEDGQPIAREDEEAGPPPLEIPAKTPERRQLAQTLEQPSLGPSELG